MTKRIDKFSFLVGALFVCLIIGCIAQVGTTGTEGRYRTVPNTELYNAPASRWFVVLDTATGTMNVWTGNEVSVHEFHVVAP